MNAWRQRLRALARVELHAAARVLALSAAVGGVAGLGAIAFQYLCQGASRLLLDGIAGFRPAGPPGELALYPPGQTPFTPWLLPFVLAFGGMLTGMIVQRFAPEAKGHGTDAAIDAFHRNGGRMRGRVPIVKAIASSLTLGSGGSGGREGPIAQIGAGFGAFLATKLGMSERDRRILLASGVGAGVGAMFRAPLAGALFAAEVLYADPEFESDVIIPAALASIVAFTVFAMRFGSRTLFETPPLEFHSILELLPYTLLAIVVTLGAGMFVRIFYGLHDAFERLRIPAVAKPVLGGALAGSLALALFAFCRDTHALDTLAFGYGTVQDGIDGRLAWSVLLVVAFGKMVTTGLSIGSGGSGGVFGPSMVIGGALGGAFGVLAHGLAPALVPQPSAYVLVGMAGFFAAAANTPISTLVMVSEMTGAYTLLLPTLWVCALAYLLGRHFSLYRKQVRSRVDSPAHRGALLEGVLRGLTVARVIEGRGAHTVAADASLGDAAEALTHSAQHSVPVTDGSGALVGIVSLGRLREAVERTDSVAPVLVDDLADPAAAVLTPADDLERALRTLVAHEIEDVPVVADRTTRRVVGMLSRRDILALYDGTLLARSRARA